LLAMVDAGAVAVISTTGGAKSLAGHDADCHWLLGLRPTEVVVVRDRDESGRTGFRSAENWWRRAGVRVPDFQLPDELGEGGELRDYLLGRIAKNGDPERAPLGTLANLDARIPAGTSGGPCFGVLISAVQPERVEWLWPGRIPCGKPTIIDGDPGLGKSTLTLEIAARVSRGETLPGYTAQRTPGGVVILSVEDGLADTI